MLLWVTIWSVLRILKTGYLCADRHMRRGLALRGDASSASAPARCTLPGGDRRCVDWRSAYHAELVPAS